MSDENPPVRISPFELRERIAKLTAQSHAGGALVAAAIVEEGLQILLLMKMRRLSNAEAEHFFGNYGPVGTFAAKIDIPYAFELIDNDLYNDLKVIKAIRNKFAHAAVETHFGSAEIIDIAQKFKGWNANLDAASVFQKTIVSCAEQIEAATDRILLAQSLADDP
jgi:DNA-binding MltR family transcriptional regulator